MKLSEAKEGRFYKANVRNYWKAPHSKASTSTTSTVVVKCTQVQYFADDPRLFISYNVYHFKTSGPEIVTTDESGPYYHDYLELIEEVTDEKMKDTTIEFIDDTHYKKLVNKGKWKEYEVGK